MSFEVLTCIFLDCDGGCDEPWGDEGYPHFDSKTDAIEFARNCGWLLIGARALCADCAAKETCARVGHRWGDWYDPVEHQGVRWRTRYCDHCSGSDHDPPWDELMVLARAAEVINGAAAGGEVDV